MFYKPLAFIVGLSIIHALVLPPPIRLHQRQNNDCLPTATLKANCWKDIGVEDYLTRWNQSTPICEPYSGGYMVNSTSIGEQDCCEQGELWSTCFMRRRYNQSGPDCSTINPQRCVIDTNSKITWGNDAAAKFYVMRAIVTINNLFVNYYHSTTASISLADLGVQDLVNQVDEIKAQSPWLDILSALIAGLGFLGAPSIGVALVSKEISAVVKASTQSSVVGIQQAPGLVKGLWPSGTTDSRLIQVGNIGNELARAHEDLADRLNNALGLLMSDVPTFLKFASSGDWTTNGTFSEYETTKGLQFAFRNYVTTQVMNKNGWYGFIDAGSLDPTKYPDLATLAASDFQGGIKCDNTTNICESQLKPVPRPGQPGYNGADWRNAVTKPRPDVPAAWWWSPATKRVFTVKKKSMSNDLGTKQMLQNLSGKWGNIDIILDGSFNCTFQGRAGSVAIDLSPSGNLDMSCISQLPIKRECTNAPCLPGSFMKDNGKTCPFDWEEGCSIKGTVAWY